jgi:hypothetical protein
MVYGRGERATGRRFMEGAVNENAKYYFPSSFSRHADQRGATGKGPLPITGFYRL